MKLHFFGTVFKKYKNDAGIDLFVEQEVTLLPYETRGVPLDCRFLIPKNYFALIVPRSSYRHKGLVCEAIYDSGFVGKYEPAVTNCSNKTIVLTRGERPLQIIFIKIPGIKLKRAPLSYIIRKSEKVSSRGIFGCGSTSCNVSI